MKSCLFLFFNVMLLFIVSAFMCFVYADGMKVKAGLWETKSVVQMPFGGGTQEHTSQDCIKESEITPEQLMKDAEGCEILNAKVDASSMQWTIRCHNSGVEMLGEGSAQSTNTTITGGMNIKATFNDQEMVMSTKWQGTYVGACK